MKTTILTAAFLILVSLTNARTNPDSISSLSPRNEQFRAYVLQPDEDMIKFRVSNPSSDKVVLKIYNEDNVKVFHRSIKKDRSYSIACDMKNCESGIVHLRGSAQRPGRTQEAVHHHELIAVQPCSSFFLMLKICIILIGPVIGTDKIHPGKTYDPVL
jgi:hypothetical protein